MSAPFSTTGSESTKRATTDVVVEFSHSHAPPTLPFELRDHVSPNTWAMRMSALVRLASQYCRPTFERAYLLVILILTLLVPITTYYIILSELEKTVHNIDEQVWLARMSALGLMFGAWVIMTVPILVWKYLGKVRVAKLAEQWTKLDMVGAPSYGAAPVWKASAPGLFRDAIVLTVIVPSKKSNFDRNSCLPPYIAVAGNDTLPPYQDSDAVTWSKDPEGGVKYGELPIYSD